jgi:hypothetical protein
MKKVIMRRLEASREPILDREMAPVEQKGGRMRWRVPRWDDFQLG